MALRRGVQSGLMVLSHSEAGLARSVAREFHATTAKRMGGHGYEEPHYVHAKHMYNLDRIKHRPLKMTLAVLSGFSFGVGVPLFAFYFQQKKTSSV
ncbi:uncharacterized protein LOC141833664 [Curcuma longa]|uniref:uncharacterized protein LOC141833664 n=1 Tax=Curcuma longa TaxID=136217 RepID=UPI003D9FA523